ncbi:MAG: hypothetical protein QXQ11_06825 [Candidatus Bathyarchaeia archaeon]
MKRVKIRISGDKEFAREIANMLKDVMGVQWREFPFYDKQKKQVDETNKSLRNPDRRVGISTRWL